MTRLLDTHRDRLAVAEMCRVLGWNPSTYYAYKTRPPPNRALRDDWLAEQIQRVHHDNYSVYGARKVWVALNREGIAVARCTVERIMRREGLKGAIRGRRRRPPQPWAPSTAAAG